MPEAGGQPIVIFGEIVRSYDFGPGHPLTPRRFGPGIDLMRQVGAERFVEPPGRDRRTARSASTIGLHRRRSARFSEHPDQPSTMGIGPGRLPGVLRHARGVRHRSPAVPSTAIERSSRGDAEHAFNPGGGLHHAMAARASGFCIYNDVALGVAAARDAGHRVLYVDLDVHHGDGTQALFWDDPQVLTLSIHETGH